MKKKHYIPLVLAFLLALVLIGCGAGGADDIFGAPPALTVTCGDEQVSALEGTSYWWYQQADGTKVAATYDSSGPWIVKEFREPLPLQSQSSNADDLTACFRWEVIPDTVSVCCVGEDVSIETTLVEGNSAALSDYYTACLKDGNYLYEVVAKWTSSELYGGTVRYSFYTEK